MTKAGWRSITVCDTVLFNYVPYRGLSLGLKYPVGIVLTLNECTYSRPSNNDQGRNILLLTTYGGIGSNGVWVPFIDRVPNDRPFHKCNKCCDLVLTVTVLT